MDILPTQHTSSKPCGGNISTVKMPHHSGDKTCAVDTLRSRVRAVDVRFKCIGLDRNNMSHSGDVRVVVTTQLRLCRCIVDIYAMSR